MRFDAKEIRKEMICLKKIKQNYYSQQKIANTNHQLHYVEDENCFLFANGIYPTKIKPEDLPQWYIYGRYYKCFGYMSAKGVVDLKYVPNLWVNHFLQDDFLLVSYHSPIEQISESELYWKRYSSYYKVIYGKVILDLLQGAQYYSEFNVSEIAEQIQNKADNLPLKHPDDFADFTFDIYHYLQKIISQENTRRTNR